MIFDIVQCEVLWQRYRSAALHCNVGIVTSETGMFECPSFDTNSNWRHVLSLTLCHCFAIVIATVATHCRQTELFLDQFEMVRHDVVFQAIFPPATPVNIIIYFLSTFGSIPFTMEHAKRSWFRSSDSDTHAQPSNAQ